MADPPSASMRFMSGPRRAHGHDGSDAGGKRLRDDETKILILRRQDKKIDLLEQIRFLLAINSPSKSDLFTPRLHHLSH